MANLTNSAKLIEEMNKKAYKTELPTVNNSTITLNVNGKTGSFTTNQASAKTVSISLSASDVSALPSSTKYWASLDLSMNSTTYVVTAQLKDQDWNNLWTAKTIDLPLESVVVSWSYDASTKKVILTLQNWSTIEFSVADLVSWLQTEITSTNKLSADLIADWTTNKTVTATEKSTWNAKQNALSTQTAYSAKGSATKVPQITTNSLGQVTSITEVTITQPDISWKADKTDVLLKNNTASFTPSWDYNPATKKYVDDAIAWAWWWNVIALTQAEYNALTESEKNDGKLRIITDAPQIEIPTPDDTAFWASWDWDTTHSPSKNAVYDAIWNIETLLAAL